MIANSQIQETWSHRAGDVFFKLLMAVYLGGAYGVVLVSLAHLLRVVV